MLCMPAEPTKLLCQAGVQRSEYVTTRSQTDESNRVFLKVPMVASQISSSLKHRMQERYRQTYHWQSPVSLCRNIDNQNPVL